MIIIYTKDDCSDCEKVKDYFLDKKAGYEERNISDENFRKELIEKGGKAEVPFLHDTSANVMMYGVDDIIDYLSEGVF